MRTLALIHGPWRELATACLLAPGVCMQTASGKNAGVFVVDDLLAWLIGLVADAGPRKLVTLMLGTDQQRALRPAVEAAVAATAAQLAPGE
jgi:hypothetical protein